MKNKEKRLGISQSWYTRSMKESEDEFIRKLIRGVYLEHNIYISEVYINRYPERISIKFLMHLTKSKHYGSLILELKSFLTSLLVLKYGKNIDINFKQCNHLLGNSKILIDWLKTEIEKNPQRSRGVLKNLFSSGLKELSKWGGKFRW